MATNFNALIHGYERGLYTVGLRWYARPRWWRFQLQKLHTVYLPAMQRCPERKSRRRIVRDNLRLAWSQRCLPVHYFHYGLYDKRVSDADMAGYLPESVFYYRLLPKVNRHHILLDDKIIAEEISRAHALPIPLTVAVRRKGTWYDGDRRPIASLREFIEALASSESGVVVKPALMTSGGDGIQVLQRVDGLWRDQHGPYDVASLFKGRSPDLILQKRELNGGSLKPFSTSVLECFRVLTVATEDGPRALYAALKVTGSRAVDNGHAGGIYVAVDLETGKLADFGCDERGQEYDRHPTTNVRFADVRIEEHATLASCAERAALAFSTLQIIGWDIALTERGPVIIEGNSSPGLALLQKPHRGLPRLVEHFRAAGLS